MIRILQQDNRATKAIFAVIIGAAIITMVITLVPGISTDAPSSNGTVFATVRNPGMFGKFGGETTSIQTVDVQREAEAQLRQQQIPPSMAQMYMGFLMQRAGQVQVERAVLQHEADKLGLQVSDDDLRNFLKSGPYAQYLFPNGQYIGEDRYIDFVQQYFQLPIKSFETELKSDLELQRLQAFVSGGVTISDAAAKAEYLQSGTKVKFDYAVVSSVAIKAGINPSDAELQAFFKQSASRYATAVPETRKISFFAIDDSAIPGGKPAVSDADVQTYYAAHQAQYQTPEQVKTRHILITVAKGADAKTDAAAKAKAEDLLKQVKAGGNFAELAKKNSDDPGSKDTGGELPMIPTASLDPAYAKAAMALSPGQTSDVVRSQFGYHIIQTEAKDTAHVKALAEVKPAIAESLSMQKATAVAQSYATQLVAEAHKDGLQKTADAHNLHVTTTDFVGRTGVIPSLSDSAALLTAAFSTTKGAAPQEAATGEGYAIFQVDDVKAAHAPDFDAFKEQLLSDYREQKAPELLNQQLIKLADRAKATSLKAAAQEMNLPLKSSDLVGRDGQVPDIGALTGPAAVAFTLPVNGISGPINEGANGAVLQVTDKQQPTADDIANNLSTTRDKLLETKRQEVFGVFVGSLMDRYEKAGAIAYSKKQPVSPLGN